MDRLSFWLGFLTATIVWFIYQSIRKIWPQLRAMFENRTADIRQLSAVGVEDRIRNETVRKAQSGHLSATLFALDEILIQPKLMAPPPQISPDNPPPTEDVVSKTISYLPDWPEFGAHFGIRTIDLEVPLKEGIRFAITGHPGSGKSTALGILASRIGRRESKYPELNETIPILLHAADLPPSISSQADPIKPLFDLVLSANPSSASSQVQAVLRSRLTSGRLLLLLDGLDELQSDQISEICTYLELLINQYPQLKMVVTASFEQLDRLARAGLKSFALAAWTKPQVQQFITKWTSAWAKDITPLISRSTPVSAPDPLLIQNWLMIAHRDLNPLEWTLLVWGTCTGDLRGNCVLDAYEAYIKRFTQPINPLELANLAVQMLAQKRFDLPQEIAFQIDEKELLASRLSTKPKRSEPHELEPIRSLIKKGFLLEKPGNRVSFAHPLILAYLAGKNYCTDTKGLQELQKQNDWLGKALGLQFTATRVDLSSDLSQIVSNSEEPLYHTLFLFARWLREIPRDHAWRQMVIARLLEFLQREMLPDTVRQRSLAALLLAGDDDLEANLQQFLGHSSPSTVSLAALGYSLIADSQGVPFLIELLANPSQMIRNTACLALVSVGTQPAIEAVAKALIQSDEDTRQAAAEALANDPIQGYSVLKEGCEVEDVLIRRAAITGISRIDEPWAIELLGKIRIEDTQWYVRNAAAQAVENLLKPNPYIPRPLVKPANAPWLIAYAARQGVGIPAGTPPTQMLLYALRGGDEEERLGALDYLRKIREPEVITAINQAVYSPIHKVRESATNILYDLAYSGENLNPQVDTQAEKSAVSTLFNTA